MELLFGAIGEARAVRLTASGNASGTGIGS